MSKSRYAVCFRQRTLTTMTAKVNFALIPAIGAVVSLQSRLIREPVAWGEWISLAVRYDSWTVPRPVAL